MKFSIKDFFSKCNQIRRKLRIWSYLLTKSLSENFIFCAVSVSSYKLILFPPTFLFHPIINNYTLSYTTSHLVFSFFSLFVIMTFSRNTSFQLEKLVKRTKNSTNSDKSAFYFPASSIQSFKFNFDVFLHLEFCRVLLILFLLNQMLNTFF